MIGNVCVKDLEHVFDAESGWCWRCGKTRNDGRRIGRVGRDRPLPVVDITAPRWSRDDA